MPEFRIGTSGWHYDHWIGPFYPLDLPKSKWLPFYAEKFTTVELNNTFYHLPTEEAVKAWRDQAPNSFLYSVKANRFLTHLKRLKDAKEPLGIFVSRVRLLGDRLGPLLYQLPPQMERDDDRLRSFLQLLPREYQHVFEFRHESWFTDGALELLREYKAGFCVFDTPGFRTPVISTTDFAYVRLHGSESMGGRYTEAQMSEWAGLIRSLSEGLKVVYVYLNNDARGFAIDNASQLNRLLSKVR
jgi:uncharacterized protein YecE (DUF72 family)